MKLRFAIPVLGLLILTSCHHKESKEEENAGPTPSQQKLIDAGWRTNETPGEELSEDFGIKPVYGTQDNYFDITMGSGCNMAVKIMDLNTDKCIRYVYVAENSTTTVHEIPQGIYYLKLAYGNDWMEWKQTA